MGHQQHHVTSQISSGDTATLHLRVGGRVRCIMGPLKGATGMVVATRADNRVLLCFAHGVYVELPAICVQRDNGQS